MRQIHSHGGRRGGGGLFRDLKADCVSVLLNLGLNKNRRKSNWEKYSPDAAWLALSPPSVSAEIKWTVAASHTFSQSSASLSRLSPAASSLFENISCLFGFLFRFQLNWCKLVCVSAFLSPSLKFDECLYIAVNGDGEEGEDELRRKIYVMRKMLEVLFGMVTLSSSLMRREWVADDPPYDTHPLFTSHLLRHPPHEAAVLCRQAASSGHGETSAAVETSAVPAGDLLPPPAERPELPGGGEVKPLRHTQDR